MDPDTFTRIPNTILKKKVFIYNVQVNKFLQRASVWRWYQTRFGADHELLPVYKIGDIMPSTRYKFVRTLILGRPHPYSVHDMHYIIADKPVYLPPKIPSIVRDLFIAHGQQDPCTSGALGQELGRAIVEAGSTDGYEWPFSSSYSNDIQQARYTKGQESRESQIATARMEYTRSKTVAAYSGLTQPLLAAPMPTRDSQVYEYLRAQGSPEYNSRAQSTDTHVDRPFSAAAIPFENRPRDSCRPSADCVLNSFFSSASSGLNSKESETLGKLFDNYRGPCSKPIFT